MLVKKRGEVIPQETRSLISTRYHNVTQAINSEFWDLDSDTANSFYVGSYGRGTAINTRDLDILVVLPDELLPQFNFMSGNVQSRLLQTIKGAISNSYPRSDIHADGQVVKINFSDDMNFEILPAFETLNHTYCYPDSNNGGRWRQTNPKAEQEAMEEKNRYSNGLLYDTCKHFRFIWDNYFKSYHLSGIVIDSIVYQAIGSWRWVSQGELSQAPGTYERGLWEAFCKLKNSDCRVLYAPGSNQAVNMSDDIEILEKVISKINH